MSQFNCLKSVFCCILLLVCVGCVMGSNSIPGNVKIRGDASHHERFKVTSGQTTLADQLAQAQSMCLIGLRGVNCGKGSDQVMKGVTEDLIVAGNGYDRWTHQVKPQVIQSKIVTVLPQAQEQSIFVGMSNAREFFSQLYPLDGKSTFFNGLYSHNSGADEMFTRYFEGAFNVYDSQQQYITHHVDSYDTANVTLLFKRIIEVLPSGMDASIYQQVIDTFGDSVTTHVEYGGVVDSTVSVRQCFSDANMESYVKSELNSVITGAGSSVPDGYARYHKVSSSDVVGGNPEISAISQRVSTFAHNPVPVKFQTVPIWTVFPEGEKRNNMKQIYDQYVSSKSNMANEMVQQLENKKIEEQRKPKVFKAFLRNKQGILEQVGDKTLALGERVEFAQLRYFLKVPKPANLQLVQMAPAIIVRHEDNSFHAEMDQSNPDAADKGIPTSLQSARVMEGCVNVPFPNVQMYTPTFGYMYYDYQEIVVCSGGQIMLAGDQRSVIFACPYVY